MRSPDVTGGRAVPIAAALAGVVCAMAALAGIGARATYGARTTADEPQYLLSAMSLADDGDLDIADELAGEGWRVFHEADLPRQTRALPSPSGTREVSPHDPLLPLLLAPGVALGGWVGAKATLALFAGALAAALVWVAVRRFGTDPRTAAVVVTLFGASMPFAAYGTQVYPALPSALAVTFAVAALSAPRLHRGACWALGACIVALPWLAVKHVGVAAVLAALGITRLVAGGRRHAAVGLALGLAAAGVVYLGVHVLVWGGPTVYASADHFVESGELGVVGFAPDYIGRTRRLVGLLVGREFGIAAWQPAWLVAVPAAAALARRGPHRTLVLAPLAAGWATATWIALTMHGYWSPGRQVVAVLPCAVLAVAWWVDGVRSRLAAVTALGLAGVASWVWLAVETTLGPRRLVIDFAATANPWYRLWATLLPEYLSPSAGMWIRHTLWAVVLGVAAVMAWRAQYPSESSPAPEAGSLPASPPAPDPSPPPSDPQATAPDASTPTSNNAGQR